MFVSLAFAWQFSHDWFLWMPVLNIPASTSLGAIVLFVVWQSIQFTVEMAGFINVALWKFVVETLL